MSVQVVASIKQQLVARGEDLSGPCGAFKITQRVAWALRADGAGLLDKPGGNNCLGFATDYVIFQHGPAFDILGDGGGANTPQWNEDDDPALIPRWRAPIDPGDVVTPPVVPPVVPPPDPLIVDALAAIVGELVGVRSQLTELKVQADANTEKIQTQINQVVKNGEKSLADALAAWKFGKPGFPGKFFP
jgi:hypothetical protein